MNEPYLGSIIPMAFNFAPVGWSMCQGQLMSIAQNTALYSLLGNTYGGDGQTTFGLPDLRGRVIVGQGQGPGLSSYDWGQVGGTESATMRVTNLPAHNHAILVNANQIEQESNDPQNRYFGGGAPGNVYTATAPDIQMNPLGATTAATGGSQPFSIVDPYVTLTYCIATEGIFPSRP